MRSIAFLAACIVISAIALAEFHPAEAQQQYHAPQGEARQRLILRALGLPASTAITHIAQVTPRQPVVVLGTYSAVYLWANNARWAYDSIVVQPSAEGDARGPSTAGISFSASQATYLVVCDITRNNTEIEAFKSQTAGSPHREALPGITWQNEGTRAALLVSHVGLVRPVYVGFSLPSGAPTNAFFSLSRCEVSAISV